MWSSRKTQSALNHTFHFIPIQWQGDSLKSKWHAKSFPVRLLSQFMTQPFLSREMAAVLAITTTADRKITVNGVKFATTGEPANYGKRLWNYKSSINLCDPTLLSPKGPSDQLQALAYVAKLPRLTWLSKSCCHCSTRRTVKQRRIIDMLSQHHWPPEYEQNIQSHPR